MLVFLVSMLCVACFVISCPHVFRMSAMVDGSKKSLFVLPVLAAWLADTPEAMRAACSYNGMYHRLQKACWTCTISGPELNVIGNWNTRNFPELHAKFPLWVAQLLIPGQMKVIDSYCAAESTYLVDVRSSVHLVAWLTHLQTVFSKLWYFRIEYNIPTCIEHYLTGGHGKNLVKWLPKIVAKVWGPQNQAQVLRFIDNYFIRFSQHRHPYASSFHNGILSTCVALCGCVHELVEFCLFQEKCWFVCFTCVPIPNVILLLNLSTIHPPSAPC